MGQSFEALSVRRMVGAGASQLGGVTLKAPNPSIERTSSSKLRLLPAAAHVER